MWIVRWCATQRGASRQQIEGRRDVGREVRWCRAKNDYIDGLRKEVHERSSVIGRTKAQTVGGNEKVLEMGV
jgi:hypothetical protein